MIEIGKTKQVAVRTKSAGRLVPVLDEHGQPMTRVVAAEVQRVTRETLGGCYGPDSERKLVVGLRAGDLLSLRPQGTRQEVQVSLRDVYRWALQAKANRLLLEKAREVKARRDAARAVRRQQAYERKLKREIFS